MTDDSLPDRIHLERILAAKPVIRRTRLSGASGMAPESRDLLACLLSCRQVSRQAWLLVQEGPALCLPARRAFGFPSQLAPQEPLSAAELLGPAPPYPALSFDIDSSLSISKPTRLDRGQLDSEQGKDSVTC